jgi:ABC-2 type transport system ATP-binding protein
VAEGTPDELKHRVPGGYARLRFRDIAHLDAAARILSAVSRDEEALTLDVPTDSSPSSLKDLLERLDQEALSVDGVTVHTPDLDDVFFALTGHAHGEVPEAENGDRR